MPTIRSWLSELGLESYWGLFEGSGYTSVDSLRLVTSLLSSHSWLAFLGGMRSMVCVWMV